MSSRIDLTIVQGDTVSEGFGCTNEITGSVPAAVVSTVECLIKAEYTDADAAAVLTLRNGSGITITSAAGWLFTIGMTRTQTGALAPGAYRWVCTTIDANGNYAEAFRGDLLVLQRGSDPTS